MSVMAARLLQSPIFRARLISCVASAASHAQAIGLLCILDKLFLSPAQSVQREADHFNDGAACRPGLHLAFIFSHNRDTERQASNRTARDSHDNASRDLSSAVWRNCNAFGCARGFNHHRRLAAERT